MKENYQQRQKERYHYGRWENGGCFLRPLQPFGKGYSIAMPPPNVTGVLHMGHLLNNTIQDVLIRYARQMGQCAFWQPGTDHAGISLQVKVEKELQKQGIFTKNLSREECLRHACNYRDAYGNIILDQLRHLGVSCDFSKKVHTLDPAYCRTVLAGFVELFRRGYIYRGRRMVNWCPVSQTAISDEEVIMEARRGKLYRIRYAIAELSGEYLEVCTTRPETIPGDVAIAVHPSDLRHRHLIGKHVCRPFPKKEIPIIGDSDVLQDFGTGALKITPAHDPVDFAIGQRHSLECLDILNGDGTLNALAGSELEGLSREDAREKSVQMLKNLGLLLEEEDYEHSVGISERSGKPIEPRLSDQWFLRYPQVERAKEVVRKGLIQFFPRHWEKTYLHWLDGIQDWCISRQLYWGHRIPVWYPKGGDRTDVSAWHVSVDGPPDPENWEQDEDVLDTWFSSAFWPMGTMGWPDPIAMETHHFQFYYPTAVLVTGPDIIFFWVARMIMMALEFLGRGDGEDLKNVIPFRAVYFTGIIRDSKGRKMSKSLGNSPEPLDLIEKYGADGVRFGLLSMAPIGQDVLFDEGRLKQGRNFCTKLWHACRFRMLQGDDFLPKLLLPPQRISGVDAAILLALIQLCEQLETALKNYEFHSAVQKVEHFFRSDYCDWFVEICKIRMKANPSLRAEILGVQDIVLRQLLQLLHPFTPFICEELWQTMGYGEGFLQDVSLLTGDGLKKQLEGLADFDGGTTAPVENLRETVGLLRALKASIGLANCKDVPMYCDGNWEEAAAEEHLFILKEMVGFSTVRVVNSLQGLSTVLTPLGTFAFEANGSDVDGAKEREKLLREAEALRSNIAANEKKLSDVKFCQRAPAEVVAGAKSLLMKNQKDLEEIERILHISQG
ncbi:MAG: valine--tRNA ligase [Puniceicoccales bacterium]|nr:valine--tRNA ligase [Puniceicoccales bacterium]